MLAASFLLCFGLVGDCWFGWGGIGFGLLCGGLGIVPWLLRDGLGLMLGCLVLMYL